jgi:hypothetical protein
MWPLCETRVSISKRYAASYSWNATSRTGGMADWAHKRTDITLRAAGALSCATAYLAIHTLGHLYNGAARAEPGVVVYLLAAIAFLCSSLGAALLVLGHHVLDRIEVSARWQRAAPPSPQPRPEGGERRLPSADTSAFDPAAESSPTPPHIAASNEMPHAWRSAEANAQLPARLQAVGQW